MLKIKLSLHKYTNWIKKKILYLKVYFIFFLFLFFLKKNVFFH